MAGWRSASGLTLIFLLAACGDRFDGTFRGSYQGQPATVTLEEEDGKVTGTVSYMGFQAAVEGTVDDDKASGNVSLSGQAIRFEATLTDDDTLEWRYPQLGTTLTLTRGDEDEGSAEGGGARDGRLVGRWRRTASGNTGAGPNRLIVTTDIYCTFGGDGTFEYGGARGGAVGPGSWPGVETGPAAVTRGEWKTEGQMLYSRVGGGGWVPVGRYSVSGSGLVVYPGGQPQYWERQ